MRVLNLVLHTRNLNQVKYNKEGDLLFTAAAEGIVGVWNSVTGELLGTLEGNEGTVNGMAATSDSKFMITGSGDATLRTWSLQTGENLQKYELGYVNSVAISPDNEYVACAISPIMGFEGSVQIYKLNKVTGEISENPITTLKYDPENKENLGFYGKLGFSYENKYLFVSTNDGSLLRFKLDELLKGEHKIDDYVKVHKEVIMDLQFSPDLTYVITASRDRFSKIIDVETMDLIKTYENMYPLNTACITPIKDFILMGGGQDAKSVTTTDSKHGGFEIKLLHKIFNNEISEFKGHFGPVVSVAVNPQGTSFTSGGQDGTVRVWFFEPSYFDYTVDISE